MLQKKGRKDPQKKWTTDHNGHDCVSLSITYCLSFVCHCAKQTWDMLGAGYGFFLQVDSEVIRSGTQSPGQWHFFPFRRGHGKPETSRETMRDVASRIEK